MSNKMEINIISPIESVTNAQIKLIPLVNYDAV